MTSQRILLAASLVLAACALTDPAVADDPPAPVPPPAQDDTPAPKPPVTSFAGVRHATARRLQRARVA